MSSQDSFHLATVGFPHSKCIWIGELAPYIILLTIKQASTFAKLSFFFQCSAEELGTTNDRTAQGSRLAEDEFEAYLMDSGEINDLGAFTSVFDASGSGHPNEKMQKGTDGAVGGLPACPRLLRVPTSGAMGMPLTLPGAAGRPGCDLSTTSILDLVSPASNTYQSTL